MHPKPILKIGDAKQKDPRWYTQQMKRNQRCDLMRGTFNLGDVPIWPKRMKRGISMELRKENHSSLKYCPTLIWFMTFASIGCTLYLRVRMLDGHWNFENFKAILPSTGNVKKSYQLTFKGATMKDYLDLFCTKFCQVKVPTEFPRKTRWADPQGLKASEWRTIALAGFVLFGSVFGNTDRSNRRIARLRYFWLLQVYLSHLTWVILSVSAIIFHCRVSPFEPMSFLRANLGIWMIMLMWIWRHSSSHGNTPSKSSLA